MNIHRRLTSLILAAALTLLLLPAGCREKAPPVGTVHVSAQNGELFLTAGLASSDYTRAGFAVSFDGGETKEVESAVTEADGFGADYPYGISASFADLPDVYTVKARAFAEKGSERTYGEELEYRHYLDHIISEANTETWTPDDVDYAKYSFCGRGEELIKEVEGKYTGTISYEKDGAPLTRDELDKLVAVRAFETPDGDDVLVTVETVDIRVLCEYTKVTAPSGLFLVVNFTTNIPTHFLVSIGKDGDTWGKTHQGEIVPEGENGTYTAAAKMTVPYVDPGDYFLNFSVDSWNGDYPFITSIPITIAESEHSDSKFRLQFAGDWDLITDEGYMGRLEDLFYSTYPRLYARFGDGREPKTITFSADKTYDGAAYAAGDGVTVGVDFANANPYSIGFFSHEITHSVQQYGNVEYGGDAWWVENMANYGGFRYFHWANEDTVQIYEATDTSLQNWGWEPYGNNKWFFAYMDAKYPTTKKSDGKLNYGLIDSINRMVKHNPNTYYEDDPKDVNNDFNKMVKEITGYDCFESLRKQFVKELKDGTWTFTGFGDYVDNFLTEGLADTADPVYPAVREKKTGNKTASPLSNVVSDGTNLLRSATIAAESGHTNEQEIGEMLIDGDKSTKWCSTVDSVSRAAYCLDGARQWIMLDLGKVTEFNTYTIFNTAYSEPACSNMREWELLVGNDGTTWTSVDYQPDCAKNDVSFNIGNQSARYLLLKVYDPDCGKSGTVRLYEMELYKK